MGSINAATAALVATIGMLLDTDGWHGEGISRRALGVLEGRCVQAPGPGLVAIARRREELPVCFGLFGEGRLTEDAMVRIARRVPAERDAEVAGWAATMMISQLTRVLAACPSSTPRPSPSRSGRSTLGTDPRDGWVRGTLPSPPTRAPWSWPGCWRARDAEFRDRNDLPAEAPVTDGAASGGELGRRPGAHGLRSLRRPRRHVPTHRAPRGTQPGRHPPRTSTADGTLGPARLHLGGHIPDAVARYLGCDAKVVLATYQAGRLLGITTTDRTPNRRLRRLLEQRDGGCAHPLCEQKRWLHAHHIVYWEDGGLTTPDNLLCLCPLHHRALHHGDFTITGNPENGTIRFTDRHGRAIEPPPFAPPGAPPNPQQPGRYQQPLGERLTRWFDLELTQT